MAVAPYRPWRNRRPSLRVPPGSAYSRRPSQPPEKGMKGMREREDDGHLHQVDDGCREPPPVESSRRRDDPPPSWAPPRPEDPGDAQQLSAKAWGPHRHHRGERARRPCGAGPATMGCRGCARTARRQIRGPTEVGSSSLSLRCRSTTRRRGRGARPG